MKRSYFTFFSAFTFTVCYGQNWILMDSLFGPLPHSIHVYRMNDSLNGRPNIAWYVEADLSDKSINFSTDTTFNRRLKPSEFYLKNRMPIVVVNTTFFSFATNQNLNVVVKNGKLVGYNIHSLPGRGKDTLTYRHPFGSAIGISKERKADIAWVYTDSSLQFPYAIQHPVMFTRNRVKEFQFDSAVHYSKIKNNKKDKPGLNKWTMESAVGGGPVLVQKGEMRITNNEEIKFAGKAINDKHPRTAMGYTKNNKLIILVVEGRNPGVAEGASLIELAEMLKQIGCHEALNLDGGGSSCLLVNGKETIKPSDKSGQRPVPAVFLINHTIRKNE